MSNTNITTTTETTTVVVEENIVRIELNNIGVQGVPGANNDPVYVTVTNKTGALLTKGSIVYVSGGNGIHTQVTKALATSDATSARVLGWLAADIANNADGLCMVEGYLDGVNTQGVTEGAQLYLSGTTAGAYQVTKPVAPIHLVYVGVAVKASAGNGRVYVKVQNGYELNELHDVLIVSPQNNQVLAYDSATQLWKNATNAPDGVTSITATAPLTGGTITSTGSIGLDQTALSITKSQVSDFTSGTVTSASTAQQAGTALFATNASTAVFATTAGTSTTISGTITKSQVSDFTSGTVTSASTAQQSGTAVYAVNSGTATYSTTSGTALTISGDITKSQVSDFTSGTVTTISGNITRSQVSDFASGTVAQATNASTAVSVSGSAISQSQVVNLVSDLANTAKLNTANTFTVGGQRIENAVAGVVPAVIRGAVSQSANLMEIQDSSSNIVTRISPVGQVISNSQAFFGAGATSILNTRLNVHAASASVIGQVIRGAASQTANLQEWQNSAGTVQASIDSSGMANLLRGNFRGAVYGTGIYYGAVNVLQESGGHGVVIQGRDSQTTDILRIRMGATPGAGNDALLVQNSGGTTLARIQSNGVINGAEVRTNNTLGVLREVASGGNLYMARATSAPANPGANIGTLYFRDGTNAGTLKLVVRAGAAGAETTILDNIPQ